MPSKTKVQQHPLVGQFFHTWENGKLQLQGRVLRIIDSRDGELLKAELYSWKDGLASGTVLMKLSSLMDGKATWYDSAEQMRSAYQDWEEKHPILPRKRA